MEAHLPHATKYADWTTDELIAEVERLRAIIAARVESEKRQALPPRSAVRWQQP
jgi:hypothetical protein